MSSDHEAKGSERLVALDGLRGLAVAGVVAYHLGAPWMAGGYLGVDLFFVLSGFLITGLLIDERRRRGAVGVAAFWGRRARRLLPALLVLLLVVSALDAAGAAGGPAGQATVGGDVVATLLYVANWHQLAAGQSYFSLFAAPSPLSHAWSLAIEEQFYALWPLVLGALGWLGWLGARRRAPLTALCSGAALASAAWMGWLAAHGASPDRLYYGTDTRAFDLLAGAALAAATAGGSPRPAGAKARRSALHVAGLVGAGVLGWAWVSAGAGADGSPPRWVFEGGMALCALAALAVVADARLARPGPLGIVLRARPLRFLGRISYALYLWHWPVVVELSASTTGLGGAALLAARLAAMGVGAVASTLLVEEPLRRWRPGPVPSGRAGGARTRRPALGRLMGAAGAPLAGAGVAAAAVVMVLGATPLTAGAVSAAGPAPAPGSAVPGAGGLGRQARLALAASLAPSPRAPLRVTLIGDSVMRGQAPAVAAALAATGAVSVTDMAYDGWGLTNDPTWPSGVPAMLRRLRPQLVVGTWSWDGAWARADPAGYRAALSRFLSTLLDPPGAAPGAQAVVLEQFPPLGPLPQASGGAAGQARRVADVRAWNAAAASMAARYPGQVLYLPLAAAVEHHGRYTSWAPSRPGGRPVRLRSVDDTHFCPAGAARYAAALLADLRSELPLPPARPGWWSGPWWRDAVYDTPPGACPPGPQGETGGGS
jgi:peptidoglycan/LPS O-acetylase OafA/YrhL